MRNYEIQIMVNGDAFSKCFIQANNAIDAFESAIENGIIYVPPNQLTEVVCINASNGVMVRFESGVL